MTKSGFVYLSLITDAYSRRIMGWSVCPTLDTTGPLEALKMAIEAAGSSSLKGLIHHSDRGGQYCSSLYTFILKEHGINISTTQDGSPYDNGLAERVNGILKREWFDAMDLENINDAREKTEKIIDTYNTKRPHMAIKFWLPEEAYKENGRKFERTMF